MRNAPHELTQLSKCGHQTPQLKGSLKEILQSIEIPSHRKARCGCKCFISLDCNIYHKSHILNCSCPDLPWAGASDCCAEVSDKETLTVSQDCGKAMEVKSKAKRQIQSCPPPCHLAWLGKDTRRPTLHTQHDQTMDARPCLSSR